jgi:hypothetical protein
MDKRVDGELLLLSILYEQREENTVVNVTHQGTQQGITPCFIPVVFLVMLAMFSK